MTNSTTPISLDTSRCNPPDGCPHAQTCRRNSRAPEGAYRVVLSAFPGGEDCHGYTPEAAQ